MDHCVARCHYQVPKKTKPIGRRPHGASTQIANFSRHRGGGAPGGLRSVRWTATAQDKEPIKIGFSMALTGPLAANGKQALLGMKIWEEETNAKGGCSGVRSSWSTTMTSRIRRPFRASTPSCSTSTKSTWCVGGYATNMVAPAMPVVIQKKKTFISLFALDVNSRVQISELFLGAADRTEDQAVVHRRPLPGRDAAESEADDGRVDLRGRGILAKRLRGRA